ncbi:MAG: putative transcriptional regulator [Herbinix sp.]|jgi:DNA-binding PadR family transcriptional regulator|nr:putative transcriptional regulator [Herbinix sp.]
MAIKNKSRYAILGVLCIKPCSGYDIKKFCDQTISHFWKENFGHIYPVLKQLEEDHYIQQINSDPSDRRKLFQITEEGKREFKDWLIQPPELSPHRSELLLKLSFGSYSSREQVIQMMMEVKERNNRNLIEYKKMEVAYLANDAAKKDPQYIYWLAPLRLGILTAEANIRWCEETIQMIKDFSTHNEQNPI